MVLIEQMEKTVGQEKKPACAEIEETVAVEIEAEVDAEQKQRDEKQQT